MPAPILATKLHIPPLTDGYLGRPRLLELLNSGSGLPLTMISASAGFGKSSLICDWLTSGQRPAAWLSLEEEESDPARFRAYLIAALAPLLPGLKEEDSFPAESSLEGFLTDLVNHVACCSEEFLLVLDDYHLIDSEEIDGIIRFLVEHAPRQMHLVIATREDPRLPLARWRSKRSMNEVREQDLRFTLPEAAAFLKAFTGVQQSGTLSQLLLERTEGWITGLQLAALSLRNQTDPEDFLRRFDGTHRYILDYLVEEVLKRQPRDRVDFLLTTSLFERFSAALADKTLNLAPGSSVPTLESLQRENLFIVPLDEGGEWFRYHHLFRDMLKKRALEGPAPEIRARLSRGALWFAEQEEYPEAISAAVQAEEPERAAEWAELAWPLMEYNFHSARWLRLVEALPEALIRSRPLLAADYGWARLNRGELEAAEEWFAAAEERERPGSGTDLLFAVAMGRIYLAQARGEYRNQEELISRARGLIEGEDRLRHAQLDSLEGLADWTAGRTAPAYLAFERAEAGFEAAGSSVYALSAAFARGLIAESAGRLREAERIFRSGAGRHERTRSSLLTGLASVQIDQYRLDEAVQSLEEARELGERSALPGWNYRRRIIEARLALAQRDYGRAELFLAEAAALRYRGPLPERYPPEALQALIDILTGALGRAGERLGRLEAKAEEYSDEFGLLIGISFSQRKGKSSTGGLEPSGGRQLLAGLKARAEKQERPGSLVEILLLEAADAELENKPETASSSLIRALELAAPEEHALPFLRGTADEKIITRLLVRLAAQGELSAFGEKILALSSAAPAPAGGQSSVPITGERLSRRETEVLELIARGCSNQEISETLFVALSTVKGHNARIFEKLGVKRRTEAVARARKLGLIPLAK
jgi:ATP/maltotriose-dependent transcriptional regulator MalT